MRLDAGGRPSSRPWISVRPTIDVFETIRTLVLCHESACFFDDERGVRYLRANEARAMPRAGHPTAR